MNRWIAGARPRTLTACAEARTGTVIVWRAAAALVVALAIQVATNYANDYSDGIRGTDDVRVGPVRLVASGLASPSQVKRAAFAAFLADAKEGRYDLEARVAV